MHQARRERVSQKFARLKIDALLVMNPASLHYLTGFRGGYTGARAILVLYPSRKPVLFADSRYVEEAKGEVGGLNVSLWPGSGYEFLRQEITSRRVGAVGLEGDALSAKAYFRVRAVLRGVGLRLLYSTVAAERMIKEAGEIELLSQAARLGDETFEYSLGLLRPGMTELEAAREIEFFMRRQGAEKAAFKVLVASGNRASYPHARAGSKQLAKGDMVLIDLGAVVQGYNSDMTRMVVLGRASSDQKKLYELVRRVQERTIAFLEAGRSASEIDRFARSLLDESGYGRHFSHNLGHGVGLEIHELPVLGPEGRGVVKPGMVTTIEPGVYLPGDVGVRIEDMVLVEKNSNQVLTRSRKDLVEI